MSKGQSEKINRILKRIGNIIVFFSILIIAYKIYANRIDLKIIFGGQNIFAFIIILFIYIGLVLIGGIPWLNFVNSLSLNNISYSEAIFVYVKSNILKYIPGNIFQYIGRNELAALHHLNHKIVALSTIADIICYACSGLLLSFLLCRDRISIWLLEHELHLHNKAVLPAAILIFIGISIVLYYLWKNESFHTICARILTRRFLCSLVFNALFYMGLSMALAAMYVVTFSLISTHSYSLSEFMVCSAMIQMALIIGFIIPGAPGGVGVREAVSLYLLKGMIDDPVILSGIIFMRILSVIGDFAAYITLWLFFIIIKKKEGKIK